jgi:hypothetical protein
LLERWSDRVTSLLEARARPVPGREPLEITGAIQAAQRSPDLARDAGATDLIVERFAAVRNPGAGTSLIDLLGWRDAEPALGRIRRDDRAVEARAAAVALLEFQDRP